MFFSHDRSSLSPVVCCVSWSVCLWSVFISGNADRQRRQARNRHFVCFGSELAVSLFRDEQTTTSWPHLGSQLWMGNTGRGVIHLYTSDDRFTLCISCLNFPAFVALPCLPQCSWGQAETPGSNVYQRSLIPSEAPHRGVFVLLIWNCSFVLQWLLMYRDVHWIVSATVDTLWTNSPTDPLWLPHRRFYSAFELCIVHIPKAPILYSKNLYDLLDLLNIK